MQMGTVIEDNKIAWGAPGSLSQNWVLATNFNGKPTAFVFPSDADGSAVRPCRETYVLVILASSPTAI